MNDKLKFAFEISLSVLNHLGRNLYRSFATVLGEAVSNSWDADAKNVWIYIDRRSNNFFIKDDGDGMTADDFQNKFLKIGYSKRKQGSVSAAKRPFIGRKGIGKLALLSCAERISIITKVKGGDYTGGTIDNRGLDKAITSDLSPEQYPLEGVDMKIFAPFIKDHENGTIIYFEKTKDNIRNTSKTLRKLMALTFRFSLVDSTFSIFLDDEKISLDDLDDLAKKTEFLWHINGLKDPYISEKLKDVKEKKELVVASEIKGFVASVERPRDLKVMSTTEKVSIDLFVNGRLRESDVLKHIPSARVTESYLYGQIHLDALDDEVDRFTTSREGLVADDPKYEEFLKTVQEKIMPVVLKDWDIWRRKHKEDGDIDDETVPPKERKAEELFNVVSQDFTLPAESPNRAKVEAWVEELGKDAAFNFASYADCFISENLVRKFIDAERVLLSEQAQRDIKQFRDKEERNKKIGNVAIDIRAYDSDISYLDMSGLATLVDRSNSLDTDSRGYKPIRDALMHTARLTDDAKRRLSSLYDNIRARIVTLLT